MNRDIKISGVVAWPSDKDRVGLMENFGLALRELVQRIGRDTEYELGTVWISERQNFEQPVDVFVNLVDVTRTFGVGAVVDRSEMAGERDQSVVVEGRQKVAGVRLESCEFNRNNLHGREDRAETGSRACGRRRQGR